MAEGDTEKSTQIQYEPPIESSATRKNVSLQEKPNVISARIAREVSERSNPLQTFGVENPLHEIREEGLKLYGGIKTEEGKRKLENFLQGGLEHPIDPGLKEFSDVELAVLTPEQIQKAKEQRAQEIEVMVEATAKILGIMDGAFEANDWPIMAKGFSIAEPLRQSQIAAEAAKRLGAELKTNGAANLESAKDFARQVIQGYRLDLTPHYPDDLRDQARTLVGLLAGNALFQQDFGGKLNDWRSFNYGALDKALEEEALIPPERITTQDFADQEKEIKPNIAPGLKTGFLLAHLVTDERLLSERGVRKEQSVTLKLAALSLIDQALQRYARMAHDHPQLVMNVHKQSAEILEILIGDKNLDDTLEEDGPFGEQVRRVYEKNQAALGPGLNRTKSV